MKSLPYLLVFFLFFPHFLFPGIKENEEKEMFPSTPEITDMEVSPTRSHEKNLIDSISFFQQLIRECPNDEALLESLGKLQVRFKLMEDAFLSYTRLIGVNPEHPDACLFLGHYYYLKGKKQLEKEDKTFRNISQPKKMEYAIYQNKVKKVLEENYKPASHYFTIFKKNKYSGKVEEILEEIYYRTTNPDPLKK